MYCPLWIPIQRGLSLSVFVFPLQPSIPPFLENAMLSISNILCLTTAFASVLAVSVGSFDDGGNTLVSAMMVVIYHLTTIHLQILILVPVDVSRKRE